MADGLRPMPDGLTYGRVLGDVSEFIADVTADGKQDRRAVRGTITFRPSVKFVVDTQTGGIIYTNPDPIDIGEDGTIDVMLIANDAPNINPTDWHYIVEIKPPGKLALEVPMHVPGGQTSLIGDVVDVTKAVTTRSTIVQGGQGPRGVPGPEGPEGPAGPAAPDDIDRITLSSDVTIDTSGWDKARVHTVLVTQDDAGGRSVTAEGESVPVLSGSGATTILAAVWSGAEWLFRSSAASGGGVPAVAPEWPAGIAATTGKPTDSTVVVTFSADIPSGTLQVRYGESDSWRTVSKSGRSVTLSGLTALTKYEAPQFQVINSAGGTDVVTAQGFTTAPRPKQWTTVFTDTFTDSDGTLLKDHTPDFGPKWTSIQNSDAVTIFGNAVLPKMPSGYQFGAAQGPDTSATILVGATSRDARVKMRVTSRGYGESRIQFTYGAKFLLLRLTPDGTPVLYAPSLTVEETSGLSTAMVRNVEVEAVATVQGDTLTLAVDGDTLRSWTVTDWSNATAAIQSVGVMFGAGGFSPGATDGTDQSNITNSVNVELWK